MQGLYTGCVAGQSGWLIESKEGMKEGRKEGRKGLFLREEGHYAADGLLAGTEITFAGQRRAFRMGLLSYASGTHAARLTDRRATGRTSYLAAYLCVSHLPILPQIADYFLLRRSLSQSGFPS